MERIQMKDSPTLLVPERVIKQIRYLCGQMSTVEWSAMLFYKILEGDIDSPATLKMEVQYVWPMAMGKAAHVSYEYDEDWVDIYDHMPELENTSIGVIHSHVNMGVFHSGTDMSDLKDNCGNYSFYLSVVTNNNTEFEAKIALKGEKEITKKTESKSLLTFKNSIGKLFNKSFDDNKEETNKTDVMFVFNVNIVPETPIISIEDFYKERTKVIMAPKSTNTFVQGNLFNQPNRHWDDGWKDYYNNPATKETVYNAYDNDVMDTDEDDTDELFDTIRSYILDGLKGITTSKEISLKGIDDTFFDFMVSVTDINEAVNLADKFFSYMMKSIDSDLNTLYLSKNREQEKINILDITLDYMSYFDYTAFRSALVDHIENYLKPLYGDEN